MLEIIATTEAGRLLAYWIALNLAGIAAGGYVKKLTK